ncbi:MAG: hypothetical protein IJ660_01960 [Alphaproteobacteria bacterium]|nr:hypothetical protein [Alphaproteobacteria bacterium]
MKKLSEEHKKYLLNKIRRSIFKKNKRHRKYALENIKTPENMNLNENYDETVKFFNKLRSACEETKKRFIIDFKPLKKISPAAALAFTAEIDRIKRIKCFRRMRVIDFKKWDRNIRLQLRDMGMFELLNVSNLPAKFNYEKNDSEDFYIPFQAGDIASGEDALKLGTLLSALIQGSVPSPRALQKGLTEAMTNSINHAYPEDYLSNNLLKKRLWWMSASLNIKNKMLTIMFYDEGIGIPNSLPRTHTEYFKSFGGLLNDDAQRIQAATQLSRTSTKQKTRGKGLKDIKDYITSNIEGMLKIFSYRGEYMYLSEGTESVKNREESLKGTLIQWKVRLQ